MTDFTDLQRAARKRVCPICTANLVLHHDAGGEYLRCTGGHRIAEIWECPTRQRVEQLIAEGELVRRDLLRLTAARDRTAAEDIADLYGD